MEYYSALKKNTFESVLMRWMKLEPIIQSEVSQKEKHQYSILTHIYGIYKDGNDNPICKTERGNQMSYMNTYMESRKMVLQIGLFAEQNCGHSEGRRGCDKKGTLLPCWWDCKLTQPLWRTIWRFLTKLGIELPYDPKI